VHGALCEGVNGARDPESITRISAVLLFLLFFSLFSLILNRFYGTHDRERENKQTPATTKWLFFVFCVVALFGWPLGSKQDARATFFSCAAN